jgi:prepilin-type N-terminal cleavage/methylation domain-containing protein
MNTSRNAFTLIELLIAVAIIGILAVISGANYIQAISRADIAACQQNLRTIHTAFMAYRADHNHFPPADGTAGRASSPDQTTWGCGPSANGFWSGVSLLLAEQRYCPESSLYCPALKRQYKDHIPAHPSCSGSLSSSQVPGWRYLRYAFNNAAVDAGGYAGGEHNIETNWTQNVWLVRCLHLDVGAFNPERDIDFPFQFPPTKEHPETNWYGEFELTVLGDIRERRVERR